MCRLLARNAGGGQESFRQILIQNVNRKSKNNYVIIIQLDMRNFEEKYPEKHQSNNLDYCR